MKPHPDQKRLFCGMDCLPGQLDLFETDGEGEGVTRYAYDLYHPGLGWCCWEPGDPTYPTAAARDEAMRRCPYTTRPRKVVQ